MIAIIFKYIYHNATNNSPVLLLHGKNSDLLLSETIAKMLENHPLLEVKNLPDCGHAPALMSLEQIYLIEKWLNRCNSVKG